MTKQIRREREENVGLEQVNFPKVVKDSGEAISHRDACIPISDLKPAEAINSTEETEEN